MGGLLGDPKMTTLFIQSRHAPLRHRHHGGALIGEEGIAGGYRHEARAVRDSNGEKWLGVRDGIRNYLITAA